MRTLVETKALIGERGAYRLAHDATAIQVPPTVQAILAARIDRLAPEDKRLLQAAQYEAEALRLAETTNHATTVGQAHGSAGWLHLRKGEWAKARSRIESAMASFRTGHIALNLPRTVANFAWVLAQIGEASEALTRLRETTSA